MGQALDSRPTWPSNLHLHQPQFAEVGEGVSQNENVMRVQGVFWALASLPLLKEPA